MADIGTFVTADVSGNPINETCYSRADLIRLYGLSEAPKSGARDQMRLASAYAEGMRQGKLWVPARSSTGAYALLMRERDVYLIYDYFKNSQKPFTVTDELRVVMERTGHPIEA